MKSKRLYGRRFGHLTAIAATGEKRYDSNVWLCICDCGSPVEVPIGYLTGGTTKSCGKCQYRGKDITGQTFGQLTAIEPTAEKSGKSYLWRCRCSCGTELLVPKDRLLNGRKTHCGCQSVPPARPAGKKSDTVEQAKPKKEKRTPGKDITGRRFGRLTALYNTGEKKNGMFIWHCVCDCGNEKDVPITALTSGGTTSCGCARMGVHTKDITGQTFGSLTALAPLEQRDRRHVIWRCRCVCGNELDVAINRLTQGAVKSCGCQRKRAVPATEAEQPSDS